MMNRFTTAFIGCLTVLATTHAAAVPPHTDLVETDIALNTTALAARAINPEFFDSYQYKEITATLDWSSSMCPGKPGWRHDLFPRVPHAVNKVSFVTCSEDPIYVNKWNFFLYEDCEERESMMASMEAITDGAMGHETRVIDGHRHQIIRQLNFKVCYKPPFLWHLSRACWGEWINKPTWDFEWQIKVAWDAIYDKQRCGEKFENAIRAACEPFEQNKFECVPQPPGALIKVRHNLLCGRTRIEKAIREASGGEMNEVCPYFVEIPVPKV
jgi:hypothetical protein